MACLCLPSINSELEVLQHSVINFVKADGAQTELADYTSHISGEAAKFQSSDHQAALIYVASL